MENESKKDDSTFTRSANAVSQYTEQQTTCIDKTVLLLGLLMQCPNIPNNRPPALTKQYFY